MTSPHEPKHIPACADGCLHPFAHVLFPLHAGPFRLKGASQFDKYGHDLSVAYETMAENDSRLSVTAYVYPASGILDEVMREVMATARDRWPSLRIVRHERTMLNGVEGVYAEAESQGEEDSAPGPGRTAAWLFELDGWFVKYRVSDDADRAWSAETYRDIESLIMAVGWPAARERLDTERQSALETSRAAVETLRRRYITESPPESELAEALSSIARGDLEAALTYAKHTQQPLPPGARIRLVMAVLEAGDVTHACSLASAMNSDDEESGHVELLLALWADERFTIAGRSGAGPETPIVISTDHAALAAHAVHQYLRWLLGSAGHMWWLRAVSVVRTGAGLRELVELALRDGRRCFLWFETDLALDEPAGDDPAVLGSLVWSEPRSLDPRMGIDASPETRPGEYYPLTARLTQHAVESILSVRRGSLDLEDEPAPAFRGLCAVSVDESLMRIRYDELDATPPEDADLAPVNAYIHYKAFRLREEGPAAYAKDDYFGMPKPEWGDERLETVMLGARQLVDWRGVSPDAPLRGLGISGFRDLLQTLHFTLVSQSLVHMGDDWAVDAMTMRHVMDGEEVTLYNAVAVARPKRARH